MPVLEKKLTYGLANMIGPKMTTKSQNENGPDIGEGPQKTYSQGLGGLGEAAWSRGMNITLQTEVRGSNAISITHQLRDQ